MRTTTRLLFLLAALNFAAPAEAAAPLGLPVPSRASLADLAATQNSSGNGRAPIPGAGACNSVAGRPISLPADDAPHQDSSFEWWFWNAHLQTADGRRYAFIVYFVSRGGMRIHAVDYTLLDIEKGRFHYGREPLLAGAPAATRDRVHLRSRGATAAGAGGADRIQVEVDGYRLDLSMRAIKPPAFPFDDGYENFFCNSSYYYARPRMTAEGTLTRGGRTQQVSGEGWFEHQWGFIPALAFAQWEQIQLQLADGRDIFLGRLTFPAGREEFVFKLGFVSDRSGHSVPLTPVEWALQPTGYWRRNAACAYPVEWNLRVKGERLTIRPSVRAAELRANRAPAALALWPEHPIYWDGETVVGGDATGRGWLDLVRRCAA